MKSSYIKKILRSLRSYGPTENQRIKLRVDELKKLEAKLFLRLLNFSVVHGWLLIIITQIENFVW
jgi:hypothetical protein